MTIKSGDVVQLKSGSEDMTVGEVDNERGVCAVVYFNFNDSKIICDEISTDVLAVKGA